MMRSEMKPKMLFVLFDGKNKKTGGALAEREDQMMWTSNRQWHDP
jgi:hypothetical protein